MTATTSRRGRAAAARGFRGAVNPKPLSRLSHASTGKQAGRGGKRRTIDYSATQGHQRKENSMPGRRAVVSDRVEWYPSMTAAAQSVGASAQGILNAIKRGGTCAGRRWAYDDTGRIGVMTSEERAKARRLLEMRRDPQDERHGTLYGYSLGCRCTACKMARSMSDKTVEALA